MSMPSINLTCEKCNFHGSTVATWGRFSYLYNETEIPVDRELGWCFGCNKLRPIECFCPDETLKVLEENTLELEKLQSKILWLVIRKIFYSDEAYYKEKIKTSALALYIASKRSGTEVCLECGGSEVSYFDGDYQLEYGGMLYKGEKRTGFLHPDCGGEFIATPSPIRLNIRFKTRYYNINGQFLRQDEE